MNLLRLVYRPSWKSHLLSALQQTELRGVGAADVARRRWLWLATEVPVDQGGLCLGSRVLERVMEIVKSEWLLV